MKTIVSTEKTFTSTYALGDDNYLINEDNYYTQRDYDGVVIEPYKYKTHYDNGLIYHELVYNVNYVAFTYVDYCAKTPYLAHLNIIDTLKNNIEMYDNSYNYIVNDGQKINLVCHSNSEEKTKLILNFNTPNKMELSIQEYLKYQTELNLRK